MDDLGVDARIDIGEQITTIFFYSILAMANDFKKISMGSAIC